MGEIADWIAKAGADLRRSFERCPSDRAHEIVAAVRARFVVGNPRVWWLALRGRRSVQSSVEKTFLEVMPSATEMVWLIPEDDSASPPVYRLHPEEVDLVRANCPLFEYNAVHPRFDWLVAETDHDEFVVCWSDEGGSR